jgi:CRISPR-associated protein Csd2
MSDVITNRMDAVLLFDIHDGNPNGDPDADNAPRVDPINQHGLVTDVCLKRKMRNFVLTSKGGEAPNAIFVTERGVLANTKQAAYDDLGLKVDRKNQDTIERVRQVMCRNYWDIRSFGGVMNTKVPAGTVRGPVQLTFARSVNPIDPALWSITRMAVETAEEARDQGGDNRTFGRKHTVPYGLYRAHLFIAPADAAKTGFNLDDLALLKQSLEMMFETDRAAARGLMTMRAVYAFTHDNALGRAQAGRLFDRIKITSGQKAPASFRDHVIDVDSTDLPAGVAIEQWV